ncbi:hypothetical protein SLEP1_g51524 [Rubroshorea leprosula]|uniref:Gnk2-homologous domain-containing protein n=1 Tax=Rubroshorea leprosula TaxID=152421 RepID=A0AAV5M3G7_9ROSI|nr:hypothetical protein SLEP1_g51524 [Rubroshorea leprosula]
MLTKPTCLNSFSTLPPKTRVDIEYEDDWSERVEFYSILNFDVANLDNFLNQLAEKGPNSGFYKTTAGEKSDEVYCLVQCRKDVSAANCANCTNQSITVAVQDCPKSKTVKVCFTWCYPRYSEQPFFSVGDKSSAAIYNCTDSDNPSVASQGFDFMNEFAAVAANQTLMLQAGRPDVGHSGWRSGMVQCNRDISRASYSKCLDAQRHDYQFYFNISTSSNDGKLQNYINHCFALILKLYLQYACSHWMLFSYARLKESPTMAQLKRNAEYEAESCDLSRLSIKALTRKLQAHEKRLAMRPDESVEGACQAMDKGKYSVARLDWKQEANKVEKGGQIILKKTVGTKESQEDSWYVDSGCTNHMVRDVKLFTKLDKSFRTRVRLGSGYVVQAGGKGNVSIQTKEVKYTPQQNVVFERKSGGGNGWKHVHTAVYLLNGLPTRAVEGKTPIDAWFGLKPLAYHLKVFGSMCYMHVPAAKRTKLDEKAKMGILVGYAAKSKGYRIYNLQSQKWKCIEMF